MTTGDLGNEVTWKGETQWSCPNMNNRRKKKNTHRWFRVLWYVENDVGAPIQGKRDAPQRRGAKSEAKDRRISTGQNKTETRRRDLTGNGGARRVEKTKAGANLNTPKFRRTFPTNTGGNLELQNGDVVRKRKGVWERRSLVANCPEGRTVPDESRNTPPGKVYPNPTSRGWKASRCGKLSLTYQKCTNDALGHEPWVISRKTKS